MSDTKKTEVNATDEIKAPEPMTAEEIAAEKIAKLFADAEAKAAQMIADTEAKAAQMLADTEAKIKKDTKQTKQTGNTYLEFLNKQKALGDEEVELELVLDDNDYKDDVYVNVNDENVQIKRGKRVKVKRKFVEVLDNTKRQNTLAVRYAKEQEEHTSARFSEIGL